MTNPTSFYRNLNKLPFCSGRIRKKSYGPKRIYENSLMNLLRRIFSSNFWTRTYTWAKQRLETDFKYCLDRPDYTFNIFSPGNFTGLSSNSLEGVASIWQSNLWPNYEQDCQDADSKVSNQYTRQKKIIIKKKACHASNNFLATFLDRKSPADGRPLNLTRCTVWIIAPINLHSLSLTNNH